MKTFWMTGLVFTALSMIAAAAPVFEMEHIFPVQGKHVHSSSVIECPNGDLLACWFHGSGERTANDVKIQGARLKKGATEWSPVFVMADSYDMPDCNPVLFIDADERLWLIWSAIVANGWEHALLKYRRAENYQGDGAPAWSWQDVIILKPGDKLATEIKEGFAELGLSTGCWGEYAYPYEELLENAAKDKLKRQKGWMTRCHLTVLPGGRILLPLYSDGFNMSLIGISDDLGETWQCSEAIVGYGPTQPSIVQKKDGGLVAYMRDEGSGKQLAQIAYSENNGENWTPATLLDIPNPSSSLEALVLQDGRWVLLCNDHPTARNPLTLMMSEDEGKSWKWKRKVEPADDTAHSFEYPSIIQAKNGLIHMSYTRKTPNGNTIAHTVVNTEWIEAGN